MKKTIFSTALLLSLLYILACNSSQNITVLPNKVAPNNCRINGIIISVEDNNFGQLCLEVQ